MGMGMGVGMALQTHAPMALAAAAAGVGPASQPLARAATSGMSTSTSSGTPRGADGVGQATGTVAAPKRVGLKEFVLLKVVGKGSFGKVMQVRKKDTGRIYAMKVLQKANIIRRNQV
jgi:serum/glucocorticoid-regulated kinase 2